MNKFKHVSDSYRANDKFVMSDSGLYVPARVNSKIEFFNDSGERIWEPLHNKTVIAGSALTAMKLFNLDRNVLDNTPTYETMLDGLDNGANGSTYPTTVISSAFGDVISSVSDECQRKIIGFCVGQGGAGLDISDVFDVKYCDCISADNIIPFRYPLANADDVDENVYKGKKTLPTLSNGQNRIAYYFKTFSNTPNLVQNYVTSIGAFSDSVSPSTVYSNSASADKAQSYVELHLKITKDDCREFFTTHKGIENAKINQLSLVSAWTKTVSVTKLDKAGNMRTNTYEYFQDIRPFSLVNIATEIMSDLSKSISILYTLYF
jgi:hypothetical protein